MRPIQKLLQLFLNLSIPPLLTINFFPLIPTTTCTPAITILLRPFPPLFLTMIITHESVFMNAVEEAFYYAKGEETAEIDLMGEMGLGGEEGADGEALAEGEVVGC